MAINWRAKGGTAIPERVAPTAYVCPWCGTKVTSNLGFDASDREHKGELLRFCSGCYRPTSIHPNGGTTPGVPYGEEVAELPPDIAGLYGEGRRCLSVQAPHATVMVARKLLMHVAVDRGADEGKRFVDYVDYLVDKNLVPPGTKEWVDEVRKIGNEANHEIQNVTADDARTSMDFVAMLLKLLYEFPSRGARAVEARREASAE